MFPSSNGGTAVCEITIAVDIGKGARAADQGLHKILSYLLRLQLHQLGRLAGALAVRSR